MELVCKVYWEMSKEVRVKLPDGGDPAICLKKASELAQEQIDVEAPGAEFVPDSINCDPATDVQLIDHSSARNHCGEGMSAKGFPC